MKFGFIEFIKVFMAGTLLQQEVNLEFYPKFDSSMPANKGAQLTIGDMHGNALKLLYFLVRHAVLILDVNNQIAQEKYSQLVKIYKKSANVFNVTAESFNVLNKDSNAVPDTTFLVKQDLVIFNKILAAASTSNAAIVRLIGDELADRGSNDYFTLKIIQKLNESGVPFEILLSNHSIGFLDTFYNEFTLEENTDNFYFDSYLKNDEQDKSLQNLGALLKRDLVSSSELNEIVTQHYLSKLKLISYSINTATETTDMTLYTHAPVEFEIIAALAAKFKTSYYDKTPLLLAATIEKINAKFFEVISAGKLADYMDSRDDDSIQNPLNRIIWNRISDRANTQNNYSTLHLPNKIDTCKICYVHGHDGSWYKTPEKYQQYVINLDNKLGKYESNYWTQYKNFNHTGLYTILYSHETTFPASELLIASETVS